MIRFSALTCGNEPGFRLSQLLTRSRNDHAFSVHMQIPNFSKRKIELTHESLVKNPQKGFVKSMNLIKGGGI